MRFLFCIFLAYIEEALRKASVSFRYAARSTSLNVEVLVGLLIILLDALFFFFVASCYNKSSILFQWDTTAVVNCEYMCL